jgi:hypothetical protein
MTGMRVALVIGAVLLVACGSDGNGGPSALEQQCLDFADVACSSNAKCAVSTGAIQQTDSAMFVSSCKTAAVNGLSCSTVKAVSGSVANCKADYEAASCTTFVLPNGLPVPASCRGLFLR